MSLTPQELANKIDELINKYTSTTDDNEQEKIADEIEKLENSLMANPIIKKILPDKYEEDVKLSKQLSESTDSTIDLLKNFGGELGTESKNIITKEIKDNLDQELKQYSDEIIKFDNANATDKNTIGDNFAKNFQNLLDFIHNNPILSPHENDIMNLAPFVDNLKVTQYSYKVDNGAFFKFGKNGPKDVTVDVKTETIGNFMEKTIDMTKNNVYFVLLPMTPAINNGITNIPGLSNGQKVNWNVISYSDFFKYVVKSIINFIKLNEDNWIDEYVKSEMVGGKLTLAQKLAMQQTIARLQQLKPILIAMPQTTPMLPPAKPMSATGLPGLQNEEKMRKIAQAILLYHISMITDKDTEMIDKLKNFGCDDQFITSIIMAPNKKIVAELVKSYKPSQYDMLYQLIVNSRRESEKIKFQRNWSVPFNSMSYGVNAYNNMFWKNSPSQINFM